MPGPGWLQPAARRGSETAPPLPTAAPGSPGLAAEAGGDPSGYAAVIAAVIAAAVASTPSTRALAKGHAPLAPDPCRPQADGEAQWEANDSGGERLRWEDGMARVLIVHASREGHTVHVAEALAEALRGDGHDAGLLPSVPFPGVGDSDGVIVAASVHRRRYPFALVRAVRAHRQVLEHLPSAFLSVCLCAAASDPLRRAEADGYLQDFLARTGWHPDLYGTAAGALRFSRYGPLTARFVRSLLRRQGLPADGRSDRAFTDWAAVQHFATSFSLLLAEPSHRRFEPHLRTPRPS